MKSNLRARRFYCFESQNAKRALRSGRVLGFYAARKVPYVLRFHASLHGHPHPRWRIRGDAGGVVGGRMYHSRARPYRRRGGWRQRRGIGEDSRLCRSVVVMFLRQRLAEQGGRTERGCQPARFQPRPSERDAMARRTKTIDVILRPFFRKSR